MSKTEQQYIEERLAKRSYFYEKKQVIGLLCYALLASLIVKFAVDYQLFPLEALTHFEFYKSVFSGVMMLCVIPFMVAYFSGRLLSWVSFLLRSDQEYPTQYFIAWILSLMFTYFLVTTGIQTLQNYQNLMQQCQSQAEVTATAAKYSGSCAKRVMSVYAKVRQCRVWKDAVMRGDCVHKVLKRNGFIP